MAPRHGARELFVRPRPGPDPAPLDGAAAAVEATMDRALAVLRVVLLVNSVVVYALRNDGYPRPGLGWVLMAGLAVWTGFAVWAYSVRRDHRFVLVLDLVVTIAAMASSPLVKGPHLEGTLPGFWAMGVMAAWAIHWRILGGAVAATAITVADVLVRPHFGWSNYPYVSLLIVGGPTIGFLAGLLVRTATERDEALRVSAAVAERTHLARVVHDGVLQVLSLMQRRGAELGGEMGELGRLAAEQEVALRAFIQQRRPVPHASEVSGRGTADLGERLAGLQTPRISVVRPGVPLPGPAHVAEEVVAVVEACLSNVRHHVGRDAPAWVLVENLPDRWVVTVRDEGPGIPAGRLEEAAAQGRLGVASSIRGRVEELGGRAQVTSSPAGTEWELEVPLARPAATTRSTPVAAS